MRNYIIILTGLLFLSFSPIQANNINPTDPDPKTTTTQDSTNAMPKVFLLGSNEKEYEKLSSDYSTSLLEVNEDDSSIAFEKWNTLLKEMEAHAEMVNYDIKGVKMWLNVFWDKNGKINHIAYFLKPNSRNVKREELTSFLMDFMNNYHVPVSYENKYSHYSGAAFPTLNWKKKRKITAKGGGKNKD